MKTGGMYKSELASEVDELQGIGLNRWLQVLVAYVEHQKDERIRLQNAIIMQDHLFEEMRRLTEPCQVSSSVSRPTSMQAKQKQLGALRPPGKRMYPRKMRRSLTSTRKSCMIGSTRRSLRVSACY